jgi:hypothetical protein
MPRSRDRLLQRMNQRVWSCACACACVRVPVRCLRLCVSVFVYVHGRVHVTCVGMDLGTRYASGASAALAVPLASRGCWTVGQLPVPADTDCSRTNPASAFVGYISEVSVWGMLLSAGKVSMDLLVTPAGALCTLSHTRGRDELAT